MTAALLIILLAARIYLEHQQISFNQEKSIGSSSKYDPDFLLKSLVLTGYINDACKFLNASLIPLIMCTKNAYCNNIFAPIGIFLLVCQNPLQNVFTLQT